MERKRKNTPKKRPPKDHKDDHNEPPRKIRKLVAAPVKASKRCNICDLPNELLEKIVGYISHWHRPRLRKTCRRMRNICDATLLHEFHKSLRYYKCSKPEGYEYNALTAIKDATWSYVRNGFDSIFCGTILPLIWSRTRFSPNPDKMKLFLKHFYKLVDAQIGNKYSQFSRLLYTVTLMRLLGKFRSSNVLSSTLVPPNYWRMVLEVRGPWLGILWSPKSALESQDREKLLVILCEIMIADSLHRAFKKVWECDSEVFVYGNDTSEKLERLKKPTTVFTFKITAPPKIVSLLKSSLEDDQIKWPKRIPKNEFVVAIDIACKEALKWGCCPVHKIEIGPDFEPNREGGDQQREDVSLEDLLRAASAISTETSVEMG